MNKTTCLLLLGLTLFSASAETETETIQCLKSSTFLAPADSPDHLKYAPDREVQVLHLALEVTPDFKQRTVAGKAVWQFKPLIKPLRELRLDAVDLTVESVTSTEKIEAFQATDQNLIITFAEPIPADKQVSVTVAYHAEPTQGLYFRTPEMGYKTG